MKHFLVKVQIIIKIKVTINGYYDIVLCEWLNLHKRRMENENRKIDSRI